MIKVCLPLTKKTRIRFSAGDQLLLTGRIYTARDAAHKMFQSRIKLEKSLPIALEDNILYYCGPTPARPSTIIGSCGPTTSSRMDSFTPELMDMGLSATIGKGSRSQDVLDSIKKNKAMYLVAVGGAGAYLASRIKQARPVAYKKLGPEAIYELYVEDFPVIVAIDSKGNNIFNKDYHAKK
jgi:fumarate hydratase subunit beta